MDHDQSDAEKQPSVKEEADVVTQLQDHIALICSRFFNFIGALQRDAPPAPIHIAGNPDQQQEEVQKQILVMRTEILDSLKTLESLIKSLPDGKTTEESTQWQEAARLEAEDAAQTGALRVELETARAKIDAMYSAHGQLATVALAAGPPSLSCSSPLAAAVDKT